MRNGTIIWVLLVALGLALGGSANAAINDPTDLSDLALWLDAQDAGTISTTTVGSRDEVDQWDDKSGNTNHALGVDGTDWFTSAACERPTYIATNGING